MNQTFSCSWHLLLHAPSGHEPDRREEDAPAPGCGLDAIQATACLARLDNRPQLERSSFHERRSVPAASGIPRRGTLAQLQQCGARARCHPVGGEPGGPAARGAASRGASGPYDTERVGDGRGEAARGGCGSGVGACARRAERGVRSTGRSRWSRAAVGASRGRALRHRPRGPYVSHPSSARRGRSRGRRSLRGHRGGGVRRRGAPQRGDRARHGAGATHGAVPLRGGGLARLPRAPRDTGTPGGSPAPRVHHLPLADDRSALRLGAGARPQELARAGSRWRRQRRLLVERLSCGAGGRARLRLRADGVGAATHGPAATGARALCADGSGLLPLLPQRRAAFGTAASVRRTWRRSWPCALCRDKDWRGACNGLFSAAPPAPPSSARTPSSTGR